MGNLYSVGINRIFYKSVNFGIGKTVTAYLWNPALVKSALQTFTELESGLYYLDYNFAVEGSYAGLFYENGVATIPGTFKVSADEGGGDATAEAVRIEMDANSTKLAAIKAKTDTLGGAGTITWPFQVTDTSGNPIIGAEVHVTGPSGETADGVTDASGFVNPTFQLNAGVNTFRVSAAGKNIGTKQETVA